MLMLMRQPENGKCSDSLSPRETLRFVLRQGLLRLRNPCRQGTLCEGLKVEQHRISPPDSVALLNGQLLRYLVVTLVVYHTFQRIPILACDAHPIYSSLIV